MTAHTAQHRKGRPAVAGVLGELRKTRGLVTDLADELARVTAERDELRSLIASMAGEDHAWCRAAVEAAAAAGEREGYEQGREDEASERDRDWHAIANPVSRSGPAFAALELLRWGPGLEDCPEHGQGCNGRLHAGDARPGDFHGRGPAVRSVA